MSNLKNKFTFIIIAVLIIIMCRSGISYAKGSMSAQISKTTVYVGDTFTVTVSANSAAGTYSVTTNNSNATISSSSSGFLDSSSETWTFKATKAGTVAITVKATDLIDADDDSIAINYNKTFNVTIKEKTSNSGSSSNSSNTSGSSTTKPSTSTTTAPKFTSVSETVYATENGINVRASYSTSSSALGSLSKGESLKRTGVATTTINGIKWSKVTYKGQTAYVSSAYLTTTKPVEETKKEETKVDNTTKNEVSNSEISNNEIDNNEIVNNANIEKPVENNDENDVINMVDEKLQLSKLEIAGVNFTEGFNPEIYSYTLQLNFFVKDLNITAEANMQDAQVEIIGNENFEEGENNITILVTSADMQETITYQIKVVIPSEVASAPQNNIQLYFICGIIILATIVIIFVIKVIYNKNVNKAEQSNLDNNNEFTETQENKELKREKVRKTKGGKHSN